MKTREDFVSNSSSSSFIVIANAGNDCTSGISASMSSYSEKWRAYEFPNDNDKHEFGWEFEDTCSFAGKMNFIGIQLLYLFIEKFIDKTSGEKKNDIWCREFTGEDFDRLYDMVKKVCLEKFHFHVKLNDSITKMNIWHDEEKGYFGWLSLDDNFYIDHQSASSEGSCMEMFRSEDALYDFLRFDESYIRGGNDNV